MGKSRDIDVGNRKARRSSRQDSPAERSAFEELEGSKEVIVVEQDESLLIRPRRKTDLTRYFDSIEVDVDPKAFADYSLLKHELLKQQKESKSN